MKRKALVLAIVLVVVAIGGPRLLAADTGSSNAARRGVTIGIDNFTFGPQVITVRAGTQVTWVNRDDAPHKIVSTSSVFVSPVLDTDGRFAYTFKTPGTYAYFCSIHPMMTGKVIVK